MSDPFQTNTPGPRAVQLLNDLWNLVVGGGAAIWGGIAGTLADQADLQAELDAKAPLASPALTGTPTAPTAALGTNTTQIATMAALQAALAALAGPLDFVSFTDCSANPNYPAATKGDAYIVSVAGKIGGGSGTSADVGDWYVAIADNAGGTEAAVGASWGHMEHNLVGALLASNNLSDLANAGTALSNLGLSADGKALVTAANYAAMRALLSVNRVSLTGYFPGIAANVNTDLRLFPNIAGTLTTLKAWASDNVPVDTTVALLKNGAAFASVTITAGSSTATATVSLAQLAGDYNTATLTGSGAQNVGFRADYTV